MQIREIRSLKRQDETWQRCRRTKTSVTDPIDLKTDSIAQRLEEPAARVRRFQVREICSRHTRCHLSQITTLVPNKNQAQTQKEVTTITTSGERGA